MTRTATSEEPAATFERRWPLTVGVIASLLFPLAGIVVGVAERDTVILPGALVALGFYGILGYLAVSRRLEWARWTIFAMLLGTSLSSAVLVPTLWMNGTGVRVTVLAITLFYAVAAALVALPATRRPENGTFQQLPPERRHSDLPRAGRFVHLRQLMFLYALVGWIAFVAIRVEVLNAAAGTLLPGLNDALARNRADGGSGKWRRLWLNEQRWRAFNIRDAEGKPDPRPLTAEEQARMTGDIERANSSARLHDFISYFGWLLQYVAVFVACLTGGAWVLEYRRRSRLAVAYALPTLVAAAAGTLAVYRGYFTSIWSGI